VVFLIVFGFFFAELILGLCGEFLEAVRDHGMIVCDDDLNDNFCNDLNVDFYRGGDLDFVLKIFAVGEVEHFAKLTQVFDFETFVT